MSSLIEVGLQYQTLFLSRRFHAPSYSQAWDEATRYAGLTTEFPPTWEMGTDRAANADRCTAAHPGTTWGEDPRQTQMPSGSMWHERGTMQGV